MKILHTSDWHLGRNLFGRKRYDEFEAFLHWLEELIKNEKIEILLIAGDIFDTTTPGNRAQELYYEFLNHVSGSCCRHIIITGGNHDSPSFLNAPSTLLKNMNVHVIGSACEHPEDEIIDTGEALVCAIPYLRERDLITAEAGESGGDKDQRLAEGIRTHYEEVCLLAEKQRKKNQPIIAMGHLFTAGGQTKEHDGVREIHVGTLAHIRGDAFPENIDYLALGHLHVPQKVAGSDIKRYCGSPIAMGFGEAEQQKTVIIVDFEEKKPSVRPVSVPVFQELKQIKGNLDEITESIQKLNDSGSSAWLEIEYTGKEVISNLRDSVEKAVEDSSLEIGRIINRRLVEQLMKKTEHEEILEDLDHKEVFIRCMDSHEIPPEQKDELMRSFTAVINEIEEEDNNED